MSFGSDSDRADFVDTTVPPNQRLGRTAAEYPDLDETPPGAITTRRHNDPAPGMLRFGVLVPNAAAVRSLLHLLLVSSLCHRRLASVSTTCLIRHYVLSKFMSWKPTLSCHCLSVVVPRTGAREPRGTEGSLVTLQKAMRLGAWKGRSHWRVIVCFAGGTNHVSTACGRRPKRGGRRQTTHGRRGLSRLSLETPVTGDWVELSIYLIWGYRTPGKCIIIMWRLGSLFIGTEAPTDSPKWSFLQNLDVANIREMSRTTTNLQMHCVICKDDREADTESERVCGGSPARLRSGSPYTPRLHLRDP